MEIWTTSPIVICMACRHGIREAGIHVLPELRVAFCYTRSTRSASVVFQTYIIVFDTHICDSKLMISLVLVPVIYFFSCAFKIMVFSVDRQRLRDEFEVSVAVCYSCLWIAANSQPVVVVDTVI